jgi:hypothetical protein
MLLATLLGWLEREHRDAIAFLREENRTLKAQLAPRRLRLNDAQRRRLAVLGQRLGRATLREVATLVTPDTILRWHRELRAEMDLRSAATRATGGARRDSALGGADGQRKSELGLRTDSRSPEERGPSRRSIHDCEHPQRGRYSPQS